LLKQLSFIIISMMLGVEETTTTKIV